VPLRTFYVVSSVYLVVGLVASAAAAVVPAVFVLAVSVAGPCLERMYLITIQRCIGFNWEA
jgi:hypothetical protein